MTIQSKNKTTQTFQQVWRCTTIIS